MADLAHMLLPIATAGVAVILLFGLWNMMRGGTASFSQKMMRSRVVMQFIAILVALAALYFSAA